MPAGGPGEVATGGTSGVTHPASDLGSAAAWSPFTVARIPRLLFGPGRIVEAPGVVAGFGRRALVVTGARSFESGPAWEPLRRGLADAGVEWDHLRVAGEPSPDLVDAAVGARRESPPDVVVGIGGGSALDAAKAIAGLLRSGTSALDHLEGVGRGVPYPGPATPFVAIPTTAGTGSEVTRNAVLSGRLPGADPASAAFKKSFRDDQLVARVALLDPRPPRRVPAGSDRRRRDGRADAASRGVHVLRRLAVHGRGRRGRTAGSGGRHCPSGMPRQPGTRPSRR